MSPMWRVAKACIGPTLLKQDHEQTKLLVFLVFANVLFDLDQPWHGQLDSANKGVDHIHVRHSLDEVLLSNWSICLPRQQLDSLQMKQQTMYASTVCKNGTRYTQNLECMYGN